MFVLPHLYSASFICDFFIIYSPSYSFPIFFLSLLNLKSSQVDRQSETSDGGKEMLRMGEDKVVLCVCVCVHCGLSQG